MPVASAPCLIHAGPAVVDVHECGVAPYVETPAQLLFSVAVYLPNVHLMARGRQDGRRTETRRERERETERQTMDDGGALKKRALERFPLLRGSGPLAPLPTARGELIRSTACPTAASHQLSATPAVGRTWQIIFFRSSGDDGGAV